MNIKPFLSLLALSSIIYSCKKESEPVSNTSPTSYANYSQLAVGNYWVYEKFDIDSNGVATQLGKYDSSYVEKDTIINAKKYFKILKPSYDPPTMEIVFERDSLH